MKKWILFVFFIPVIARAQQVDKRLELLSIVYKLANGTNSYKHFERYDHHPLITYVKELIDSFQKDSIDIGSWEIPSLAVHLSQPPKLDPLISYSDTMNKDGWDDRTLLTPKFVRLLKQFYKDAHCNVFFLSQQRYYDSVNRYYEEKAVQLDKKWLNSFFSVSPTEYYFALISLQNLGSGNYLRVNFKNGTRLTHTIFTGDAFEAFARSNLHEYIHCFVNQLIDKNFSQVQGSAEKILANPAVSTTMQNTFYANPRYLLYESLVRASAIVYLKHQEKIITTEEKEIAKQEKAGFRWMKGLVELLDTYASNRNKYRDLEMFMPEVVNYFKKVADEISVNQ